MKETVDIVPSSSPLLERESPIPLYYQLQAILRDQIDAGVLKPGDEVPSEKDLMEQYNVSRATVRRALDELVRHGYVTRHQGRGTYVSVKLEDTRAERLRGFLEDMSARGFKIGAKILFNGTVPAPLKVSKQLGLPEGTPVYLIRRIGTVEGEPIGLAEVWLGISDRLDISREELAKMEVLHTFLESLFMEKYGTHFANGEKSIEATAATPEEAQLLETETDAPMLLVRVLIRSSTGKALVFIKTLYRGDRYVYTTKLYT